MALAATICSGAVGCIRLGIRHAPMHLTNNRTNEVRRSKVAPATNHLVVILRPNRRENTTTGTRSLVAIYQSSSKTESSDCYPTSCFLQVRLTKASTGSWMEIRRRLLPSESSQLFLIKLTNISCRICLLALRLIKTALRNCLLINVYAYVPAAFDFFSSCQDRMKEFECYALK